MTENSLFYYKCQSEKKIGNINYIALENTNSPPPKGYRSSGVMEFILSRKLNLLSNVCGGW